MSNGALIDGERLFVVSFCTPTSSQHHFLLCLFHKRRSCTTPCTSPSHLLKPGTYYLVVQNHLNIVQSARQSRRTDEIRTANFWCRKPLSELAPLEAVLFDIDGTLCDSDPLHYYAFRELLVEAGYKNGVPITEDDFVELISGKHNDDIGRALFPDWDSDKVAKFLDDKEAMFRRLAVQQLKPVPGLHKLCKWIEERSLSRAAVTNAPRENAELMISILGLTDFFHVLVVGSECEKPKPYPDPYLKALGALNASPVHTVVFEDSVSGIKSGVGAGMPVVGVTTRNPAKLLMDAGASLLIKDYEDPNLWAALEGLKKAPINGVVHYT